MARSYRIRIPLAALLLVSMLIMGLVPLFLIRVVISGQAKDTVESEFTRLTRGIQEAGHADFAHRLSAIEDILSRSGRDGPAALAMRAHLDSLAEPTFQQPPDELEAVVAIRIGLQPDGGVAFVRETSDSGQKSFVRRSVAPVDFSDSDTVAMLRERPGRRFWLGGVPNVPTLGHGMWLVGIQRFEGADFLVALRLDPEWLADFTERTARATRSEVWVVTADNVVLPDDNGRFFARPWAAQAVSRVQTGRIIAFASDEPRDGASRGVLVQVFADPDSLYSLVVTTPRDQLVGSLQAAVDRSGVAVMGFAALFGVAGVGLAVAVSRRFRAIRDQFAHVGDADFPFAATGGHVGIAEVEHLVEGVADMRRRLGQALDSLRESRSALEEANARLEDKVAERTREVEQTLSSLISAQEMLVRNEKLAALGEAAAAFTHEINTPLGVCSLAVSQMEGQLSGIMADYAAGRLGKQSFETAAASLTEAMSIVRRNIQQAVAVTGSFRNVSVADGGGVRDYDLGQLLGDIRAVLSPRIRHSPYRFELDCPPGIVIRGNPALWYQLVSNFLNNSLLHGFEGRESGRMALRVESAGTGRVRVVYEDDGIGIPAEERGRVFEPYYTTKAGRGGSGLGLAIVRGLVEDQLKGTVGLDGASGAGVRFIIDFPHPV